MKAWPGAGPARAAHSIGGLHAVQRIEGLCSPVHSGASTKCPRRFQISNPHILVYPAKTGIGLISPMTTGRNLGLVISRFRVRFLVPHHSRSHRKLSKSLEPPKTRLLAVFRFGSARPNNTARPGAALPERRTGRKAVPNHNTVPAKYICPNAGVTALS